MDFQLAALGKCVLSGDLRTFVDARITTEFFPDETYSKVYQFLLDHWTDYGIEPDEAIVKQSFPNLELENHRQPTTYFVNQLRERREAVLQNEALNEAATVLNTPDDPSRVPKIRQILYDHLSRVELETSGSRDGDFTTSHERMLARLQQRRDNPGYLRGYPTGFKTIDEVTGGLQAEQFIVVTGVPKSGKSSFLLYMALTLWRCGEVPLFIGFEMSNDEQEDRLLSLMSGVSLTRILNGTTDPGEWARVQAVAVNLPKWQSLFLSADITSAMTVSGIQAKIHKYQPAAVFIDGMYLMSAGDEKQYPRGTPQALTMISRDTKKLAQSSRIPIVGTTQSLIARSKNGLNTGSMGYTSAWGQDADLILGAERQPDSNITKFHVLDSRSGPRIDTFVEWDWDRGYVGESDPAVFTPAARAKHRETEFDDD